MSQKKHAFNFISGLPRSGSTLTAAILRQNPRFHAGMSSPIAGLFDRYAKTSLWRNLPNSKVFRIVAQQEASDEQHDTMPEPSHKVSDNSVTT